MAISNSAVTTSPTQIFLSGGPQVTTTIYICNYTSATVAIDVHLVPSGSTVGNNTIIYKNISLVQEETYIMDLEKLLFNDQDSIYVTASAPNSVTATVSSYPL
jgi:hypothetical protein